MSEKQTSAYQKKIIVERAQGCCEYCHSQARFATQSFSVEHIIPHSKKGETVLDNLALACQGCNNHKYTRTKGVDPISTKEVPLFHPRKNRWLEHFSWNDDYSLIIGLTPIGRATVETLQLNREGVVNLRKILYEMGEHPVKIN